MKSNFTSKWNSLRCGHKIYDQIINLMSLSGFVMQTEKPVIICYDALFQAYVGGHFDIMRLISDCNGLINLTSPVKT
jgi:hypothetical protein